MTATAPTAVAHPVPLRPLLFVLAPCCLVALYLITWWAYAFTHLEHRYVQLDSRRGVRVRGDDDPGAEHDLRRAARRCERGRAEQPVAGATWVVAELEAQQAEGAAEFFCTFELLGPNGRTWKSEFPRTERAVPACQGDDIKPGSPHRFEVVFQVPLADADQLSGITREDPDRPTRTPVLSPPVVP